MSRRKGRSVAEPLAGTPSAAAWIEATLVNPEDGRPFVLTGAERVFLEHAFELTADGRLRYPELIFSAPKKSGKTGLAAMVLIYLVRAIGGKFAEGYAAANDLEQAQGRVFTAVKRIIEASPLLADDATITASKVEFRSTGATITAIANDYAGAAGSNPTVTAFDELWAFTSERARRFFDESVPPPTRQIACRLTTTYAGFTAESALLEGLYKRGLEGERIAPDLYAQPGMLMYWSHSFSAPWQTEDWREQMRATLRPSAYARLIENRWVTSESTFVDLAWWDGCTDAGLRPVVADVRLPVWVGVDASVTRDCTAVVAVTIDEAEQRVRLVAHRVFQPSIAEPLDFEQTVEAELFDLARRFNVREVRFDPYQMQASAQRLASARLPMVEFGQTSANLTAASSNLYELVKGRNLVAYPDEGMRLAVQRTVAIEASRGWRIAKEKTSAKIDVVVALAMAAYGAVGELTAGPTLIHRDDLVVEAPVTAAGPVEEDFGFVHGFAGLMWVGADGTAAWAIIGQAFDRPCVIVDYGVAGWRPEMLRTLVSGLDARCEQARERNMRCKNRGVGAWLWIPEPMFEMADALFDETFGPRLSRPDGRLRADRLGVEPIPASFLVEPARLVMSAMAHVSARKVTLGPAAAEKNKVVSVYSALNFRAGQRIADDPLRLVLLLAISLSFDAEPSNAPPAIPAARLTFA